MKNSSFSYSPNDAITLSSSTAQEVIDNKNINKLIAFARKTFPSDGTNDLFVGCVLIMFSRTTSYKARYSCTREHLVEVVKLAKEKIDKSNLLAFYIDRVNKTKGINKYLNNVVNDSDLDKYADLILSYLEQFKVDLVSELKNHRSLKIRKIRIATVKMRLAGS